MRYKWLLIIVLSYSFNLPINAWAILLPQEMYAQAVESAENKDYTTAFSYYKQAALRGHMPSQRILGNIYLIGEGVKQNTAQGIHWLNIAAEQKDSFAQFTLALIYHFGLYGVSIDKNKSQFWQSKLKITNPFLAAWCTLITIEKASYFYRPVFI